MESVRVQLEEEAEARLDLERQLVKANGDALSWKSKYETECNAHIEEVEELRYKILLTFFEFHEFHWNLHLSDPGRKFIRFKYWSG